MTQGVHEACARTSDEWGRVPATAPTAAVNVVYARDRPTVHVAGRIGRTVIVEVSGTVRGLVAAGVDELIVDLSVSWDTAGLLPVLARARAGLAARGGTLRVVGVAVPDLLAALAAAPLEEVFPIYDTVRHRGDRGRTARVLQRR